MNYESFESPVIDSIFPPSLVCKLGSASGEVLDLYDFGFLPHLLDPSGEVYDAYDFSIVGCDRP